MIIAYLYDVCISVIVGCFAYSNRKRIASYVKSVFTESDLLAFKLAFTVIVFAVAWIGAMIAMCAMFHVPIV